MNGLWNVTTILITAKCIIILFCSLFCNDELNNTKNIILIYLLKLQHLLGYKEINVYSWGNLEKVSVR